jgi:hypothetical protein
MFKLRPSRRREVLIVLLLLGLLFGLDVFATGAIFTSRHPGANDFYSRWKGAELLWREGTDPYSNEATAAIQLGIYGRAARPDEDPGLFAYPFYTVFLLAPLVWLPFPWAEAIWLVLLEFSLIGGVFLCLSLANWRLPGWLLAATALWANLFYHSARTILLGQFAGLVFLWTVGTLWGLEHKHDLAAGVLLALTTIKPQMSFLLVPALLLWGLGQRRWRFVGAFGLTMVLLLGASFLLLPDWLSEFLRQMTQYPSYTAIGSPIWIIAHYYLPQLGLPFEIGLSLVLLLYLVVQWRSLPRVTETDSVFHWTIGMTLIISNLIALRTATTNYVVLYLPLFFGLRAVADRLRRADLSLALFYLTSTIGLWALFLVTVEGRFEHPVMYLPLPIGLLLTFVCGRTALRKTSPVSRHAMV